MSARRTIRGLASLPFVLVAGAGASHCSCVAEGIEVLTPNGAVAIERLALGDAIFAYDPDSNALVVTEVTGVRAATRPCVRLKAGSHAVVCTHDHPLYCPDEGVYAEAAEWVEGRRTRVLLIADDGRAEIATVRVVEEGTRRVFDIAVGHDLHNFVAGGVLVHNKSVIPPDIIYRCDPAGRKPACPDGYQCCSDDPSSLDGTPLFSGPNNDASRTGMCVRNDVLPEGVGLTEPMGCPIPCNPRWDAGEVMQTCGPSSLCCHTVEIEAEDCVLEAGCWLPATGEDIFNPDLEGTWGSGPDPWDKETHETAQDPTGKQCRAFAAGDQDTFEACLRQLTVADQRGYCLGISSTLEMCPLDDPDYIDACEQQNLDEGRDCSLAP